MRRIPESRIASVVCGFLLAAPLSCSAQPDRSTPKMHQDYEQDLDRMRSACDSRDLDAIQRTMTDLDRKWAAVTGPEHVRLLRAACDRMEALGLQASERGRSLVERLATSAVRKADDPQLETQLYLLVTYL